MLKLKKPLKLDEIKDLPNIADKMKEKDLIDLAEEVITSYDHDKQSRQEWERLTEKALDIIELKHEKKNFPFVGASNVKYPLISTAVIQFAARQLPALIRNGRVAEVQVIGNDPDGAKALRAARLTKHLSFQLLHQMPEWQDDLDKLLHMLASVGIVFRKTYYDPVKERPVSEVCNYQDIVIHDDVQCLEEARRITHRITLHKNDIIERMRLKIYSSLKPEELDNEAMDSDQDDCIHEILEQHRYLDLDGDGYEEPYIVLVDRDLRKVLRIVARFTDDQIEYTDNDEILRIKPDQHFTDYHFIKSPRGNFYSLGFGQLLYSLNNSVNTILNQLIDAGTLSNTQSGIMDKRLKIPGGEFDLIPGKFHKVNLAAIEDVRKHFVPLEFKEPSNVLLQLLGVLVDATKEVSSVSDAMTGQEKAQNVPATTILALIEQGSKVFTAIQRRLYNGLQKEFQKLFHINRVFLDREVYFRILDDEAVIRSEDYDEAEYDVVPVADPSVSSEGHRLARTQALLSLIDQPGVDRREILLRYLNDLETPGVELILPPPPENPPPDPEMIKLQSEIDERGKKLELEGKSIELRQKAQMADMLKKEAEIEELRARALKSIAEAEAAELGPQLDMYKAQLSGLSMKVDALVHARNPESKFSNDDVAAVTGEQVEGDDQFNPGSVDVGPTPGNPSAS